MKLGAVSVETQSGGEVRNRFDVVDLGRRYQALVPNLVVIEDQKVEPVFNLFTEQGPGLNQVRVMAKHPGDPECNGAWITDDPDHGKLATEFFVPKSGNLLSSSEMPSVHAHIFSLMMLGAEDLYEEAYNEPWVGRIIRT